MPNDDGRLTHEEARAIHGGRGVSRYASGIDEIMRMGGNIEPERHSLEEAKYQAQLYAVSAAFGQIHNVMQTMQQVIAIAGPKTTWATKVGPEGQTIEAFAKALGVAPDNTGGGAQPIDKASLEQIGASIQGKLGQMSQVIYQLNHTNLDPDTRTALFEEFRHTVGDFNQVFAKPAAR